MKVCLNSLAPAVVNAPAFKAFAESHPCRVILKYTGTMAPMAPILLVVGGVKAVRCLSMF